MSRVYLIYLLSMQLNHSTNCKNRKWQRFYLKLCAVFDEMMCHWVISCSHIHFFSVFLRRSLCLSIDLFLLLLCYQILCVIGMYWDVDFVFFIYLCRSFSFVANILLRHCDSNSDSIDRNFIGNVFISVFVNKICRNQNGFDYTLQKKNIKREINFER